MPAPVDLVQRQDNSATTAIPPTNTQEVTALRTLAIILSQAGGYPDRFPLFDAWRPVSLSMGSGLPVATTWIRMAESITTGFTEKHDRFYQEKVGVIEHKVAKVVVPIAIGLKAQDHLVKVSSQEAFLVLDVVTQSGTESGMLSKEQSKFVQPLPVRGTVRMLSLNAYVG